MSPQCGHSAAVHLELRNSNPNGLTLTFEFRTEETDGQTDRGKTRVAAY